MSIHGRLFSFLLALFSRLGRGFLELVGHRRAGGRQFAALARIASGSHLDVSNIHDPRKIGNAVEEVAHVVVGAHHADGHRDLHVKFLLGFGPRLEQQKVQPDVPTAGGNAGQQGGDLVY